MIKKLRQNLLVKVLSLNAFSVGINFVLSLASSKIISYFLGASGMALLGNFRNFTTLLKTGSTIGVNNAVVTLLVNNKENREIQGKIYSTFFCILLLFSSSIALLGLLFATLINDWVFLNQNFVSVIRFTFLLLPIIALNIFWLAVYNGLSAFRKIIKIQIITSLVVFLSSAIGIYFYGISGGMYALVAGELLTVCATFIFLIRDYKDFPWGFSWKISWEFFDAIKKFALMALVSAVIGQIVLIQIRNQITIEADLSQAGLWEACNRLSSFAMTFFSTGLALYYLPKLADIETETDFRKELGLYFKIMLPLSLVVFSGMYVLRTLIIPLIFTKEFLPLDQYLSWQLAGEFLKVLYLAFGFRLVVQQRVWEYILVEVGFYLSYYFIGMKLIPETLALGATQAYFYSNVIAFVLMLIVFRKTISGYFSR